MDKLDKLIKKSLKNQRTSEKYNQMIKDTMNMISNNEIEKEKTRRNNVKSNIRYLKIIQSLVAVFAIVILTGITYAGMTGKLSFIKTGNKKIDENYGDVAVEIGESFENDYCTFTLESMGADPAYLIYEYILNLKDSVSEKVPEIFDDYKGYMIYLEQELTINDKKNDNLASWRTIEKISDNQFRIVNVYNIANISENLLITNQKIDKLYIGKYPEELEIEINKEIKANVNFSNNEKNILSETKLANGSTLYIEEVANSKFENYVLARIITSPKTKKEIESKEKEFMIEDPQFAICNQNDESINYDYTRLEEYYEKVSEDGKTVELFENDKWADLKDTDLLRIQQVQLLRLGIDKENVPKTLKILPLNRKLYNDRNDSERNFYMNENWYELKLGENNILEDSTIGGSVTITKIEETEDKIILYYDRKGFVQSDIDCVLRIKSETMNYRYPKKTELKQIDGTENKIIFRKNEYYPVGLPLLNHNEIKSVDETEFALFYNTKYDILSEALEFSWNPETNNKSGIIENIKIDDFENEN